MESSESSDGYGGTRARVVAVGCSVDSSTYRGSYEDLETLRTFSQGSVNGLNKMPIVCADFVVYAYQLFKAKASGADAIKVNAAVLPAAEVAYMCKIARKIKLDVICVCSSKTQVLQVLEAAGPLLAAISISSRNSRLWKRAPGKAENILKDEEVRAAIRAVQKKQQVEGEGEKTQETQDKEGLLALKGMIVLQEAILAPEIGKAALDPLVDGVVLGEELLGSRGETYEQAVRAALGLVI